MKVISLNLSTLATGKYAPIDKTNLANIRWMIDWKEILGEYYNTNKHCRVKCKLISSSSSLLNLTNNQGTIRANFTSNYSNINNGFTLGISDVIQISNVNQIFTATMSGSSLTISPFGDGSFISFTGGTGGFSSTTLTLGSALALPIGSLICGSGIVGFTVITAQTGATTYTMSTTQTLATGTALVAGQGNKIQLPIGTSITGFGVPANTVITTQITSYSYLLNNSTYINTTPMISDTNTYYLALDTLQTSGLSINTPMSNFFNIQFIKSDDTTLMSNIQDYTIMLNFEMDEW